MANQGVEGRIVDFQSQEGLKHPKLKIKVIDFDPFFNFDDLLAVGTIDDLDADGNFKLEYSPDAYKLWIGDRKPDIVVQVYVEGCRLIFETREAKDVEVDILDVGTIEIHKDNIEGWLVTNASLDSKIAQPVALSQGNKVKYLIDGAEMFPAITEAVRSAQESINLMTLNFEAFVMDDGVKKPLITEFHEDFNPHNPVLGVVPCDKFIRESVKGRIQEEILDKPFPSGNPSDPNNFEANILINDIPLSAADFVSETNEFFEDTGVNIRDFNKGLSLLHTKNLIVDGERAYVMGSPISQRYFTDQKHFIRDARHNGSNNHDVSMEVIGPAVDTIDRTFSTIWRASVEAIDLPIVTPASGNQPQVDGDLVSAQVLRTMPGGIFTSGIPEVDRLPHGETAILEAYQRAISNAEKFIYIENQYFTSRDIVSALMERLKHPTKNKLQVIFVLNFKPDLPGYADAQRTFLQLLKIEVESNGHQMGVYTLWSRQRLVEESTAEKSVYEIMPIYVHSKLAVIDDTWATLGSANLDGTSMNYHQIGLMVGATLFDKFKDQFALEQDFGKFLEDAFFYVYKHILKLFLEVNKKILIANALIIVTVGVVVGLLVAIISDSVQNKILKTIKEYIQTAKEYIEIILEVGDIPDIIKDVFERPSQHAITTRSGQPPRNIELNLVLYNGIADQPESPSVPQLRHRLWQEHLGMDDLPQELIDVPENFNNTSWVDVWDTIAATNLDQIKNNTNQLGFRPLILKWVPETDAECYLENLKIRTKNLRSKGDQFDFTKCEWKKKENIKPIPWLI